MRDRGSPRNLLPDLHHSFVRHMAERIPARPPPEPRALYDALQSIAAEAHAWWARASEEHLPAMLGPGRITAVDVDASTGRVTVRLEVHLAGSRLEFTQGGAVLESIDHGEIEQRMLAGFGHPDPHHQIASDAARPPPEPRALYDAPPVADELPAPESRKESWDDFLKRSSELIDECRDRHGVGDDVLDDQETWVDSPADPDADACSPPGRRWCDCYGGLVPEGEECHFGPCPAQCAACGAGRPDFGRCPGCGT